MHHEMQEMDQETAQLQADGEALSSLLAPMWRHHKRATARDFEWAQSTPFFREELARIRGRFDADANVSEEEAEMFAFFSTMDHYDDNNDAGSDDRDDRPPPSSGGAGAVV